MDEIDRLTNVLLAAQAERDSLREQLALIEDQKREENERFLRDWTGAREAIERIEALIHPDSGLAMTPIAKHLRMFRERQIREALDGSGEGPRVPD